MITTKAFHAFQQKMFYFGDDLDLVDFLSGIVQSGKLSKDTDITIFSGLDSAKYSCLARRKNSPGSRTLLMTHLKQSIYASYIKDVYEEVSEYLRMILTNYFSCNINCPRLIGEHNVSIDAQQLLALGNWDGVCRYVAGQIYQSLENERSTSSLLKKMQKKIGISIPKKTIEEVLPYLEIRHFLVHSDGKMDDNFVAKNPTFSHDEYNFIRLDYNFITEFRSKITHFITEFDAKIIEKNCLNKKFLKGGK